MAARPCRRRDVGGVWVPTAWVPTAARVAVLVVVAGVAAGLTGGAMAWALLRIQSLTYGSTSESLLDEVRAASDLRRVLGPACGGLLAGLGWWALRHRGPVRTVAEALSEPGARLPLRRTLADAWLQILVVGSGASLGREGAPRQASAAVAEALGRRWGVPAALRDTAVAAAAGAGLAAVYNVPLAGVVFTLAVLPTRPTHRTPLGTRLVICLAMSGIATVVAWPVVTNRPTYVFPEVRPAAATLSWALAWAVLCVPLCALVGFGFRRLARAAQRRATGSSGRLALSVALASAIVGAASVGLPELPGNGKDILQLAFSGHGSVGVFALLLVVKPLATSVCLRAGAVGGLLTPALATGAALGGLAATTPALVPQLAAPQFALPVFALVAAAGVLAVTQRSPLFALVMTWELTHAPVWTIPLLVLTAYGGHAVVRIATARA